MHFVPLCLETDKLAFLLHLATGFYSVDLLIFQLEYLAKLPEYTSYPMPGAERRLHSRTLFA